jgi:CSLREA domain-containing protein
MRKPLGVLVLAAALAVLSLSAHPPAASAATFTVNTADDTNDGACDGAHCSLREAIIAANAVSGADTIEFDIGGGGLATIQPNSSGLGDLPAATATLTIDGTTQPGYAGTPIIELDGSLGASYGLRAVAGTLTARALVVNSFAAAGVYGTTNSLTEVHVEDSYVGTDFTGTAADGNGAGIRTDTFAGFVIADSIISGNVTGIYTDRGFGSIRSSLIGTDVSGTGAIGNGTGVHVHEGFAFIGGNVADRNVISGNAGCALVLTRDPFQDQPSAAVSYNYIGTDITGSSAVGNGCGLTTSAGEISASHNVISGNSGSAISTSGLTGRTWALFNLIGTNAAGTSAIPNGRGIQLWSQVNTQSIGNSTSTVANNVIAGNAGEGIHAAGGYHFITLNKIGVLADGTTPLGNGGDGVYITADLTLVSGNVIAHSGAGGVVIDGGDDVPFVGDGGDRNTLHANSIHSNAGAGIVLVNGAQESIPPPALTSVTLFGVLGTACAGCEVQVFTDSADEGRRYHGSVYAEANGTWSFPFGLVGRITATQLSVPPIGSNTSAFAVHVLRTGADADGDGLDDTTEGCPGFYAESPYNHDDFIDLAPDRPFDDATWANSDGLDDACDADDDNDGLTDAQEDAGGCGLGGGGPQTNPFDWDHDDDLVLDGVECAIGTSPNLEFETPTPAQCGSTGDADADGVVDYREVCYYGTSTSSADSDGDGCSDRREIASVNGDLVVNVIDLQQVASMAGPYGQGFEIPTAVEMAYDITKNMTIDVIDLQQVAAAQGSCT